MRLFLALTFLSSAAFASPATEAVVTLMNEIAAHPAQYELMDMNKHAIGKSQLDACVTLTHELAETFNSGKITGSVTTQESVIGETRMNLSLIGPAAQTFDDGAVKYNGVESGFNLSRVGAYDPDAGSFNLGEVSVRVWKNLSQPQAKLAAYLGCYESAAKTDGVYPD